MVPIWTVSYTHLDVYKRQGQGSLNCWFFGSVYTLPVLAIYRWHSRRKRVFKKDPSINKVLREEKEDIEAQKYDAGMILWYSKI